VNAAEIVPRERIFAARRPLMADFWDRPFTYVDDLAIIVID
jgi:hypothetical protein